MAQIGLTNNNYINLAANTWTSLMAGTTGGGNAGRTNPFGKTGSLYVSTTGGTIIAMSLDGGTTFNFLLPSNVVVNLGAIDPNTLSARCGAANNIITWWWVTE